MKSKYKILVQISLFLTFIAISISMANYYVSLNFSEKQLKTISLPLSLDNIYTEIQKNIVEPYLVSSMMANDTFVQDWLKDSKQDESKIIEYLSAVKNRYNMFTTFLVSDITKKYYTQDSFIEKVSAKNKHNQWYFNFINNQNIHEINIDANKNLSNSLMMFINYKILDSKYKLMGATGVALKTEYINNMLKKFRQRYGFKVTFFNHLGEVVLSELNYNSYISIDSNTILKSIKEKIISKESNTIEFRKNDEKYIVHTKYIKELNLYLTIEAKLSDHTNVSMEILYFNLLASLGVVLFVVIILYRIIQNNSEKLEDLAFYDSLTQLHNRRFFETKLLDHIASIKRNKENFCIVFIDVDDFKYVNDTKGHDVGDEILKIVSNILKESIREVDTISRWGGEEIIILLSNSDIKTAQMLTKKLKLLLENNIKIQEILSYSLTASFGVTQFRKDDDIDSVIKRADEAMYISKNSGKNKVSVL